MENCLTGMRVIDRFEYVIYAGTFFGVDNCLSNSSSLCTISGLERSSEKDLSLLIFCITPKTSCEVTPCFMSYSICFAQLDVVLYFLKLRFSNDDAVGDIPFM